MNWREWRRSTHEAKCLQWFVAAVFSEKKKKKIIHFFLKKVLTIRISQ